MLCQFDRTLHNDYINEDIESIDILSVICIWYGFIIQPIVFDIWTEMFILHKMYIKTQHCSDITCFHVMYHDCLILFISSIQCV